MPTTLSLTAPPVARWSVSPSLPQPATSGERTTELVVLGRSAEAEQPWGPAGRLLDEVCGSGVATGAGAELVAAFDPPTTAGACTTIPLAGAAYARVHLLARGTGLADLRAAGAAAGRATRDRERVVVHTGRLSADGLAAFVEGYTLGQWAPPRWTHGTVVAGAAPARAVVLVGDQDSAGVERAVRRATATQLGRNLAATPSNLKNPAWMVAQARTVARRGGLDLRVWDEKQLHREGFGGLLAVGGGSATPPRLVELAYQPAETPQAGSPHVVLVGKGITFDSGGLQVKPAEGMATMKTDMSGSAVVLAVLGALRDLAIPVRVTGLLALAENAVSGSSYRPGDVLTQYGGRTVEIGNTDAEGRIVLADALAYADAHLDPDFLVDVATLTGAARVALARIAAPVYATDDALRNALVAAGETTGETLWPMPLADVYRRALDSDVAELSHIADGVGGGSITAALFLREFAGARRWAHLDIAGPGRSDVDAGVLGKGGTAFGTRLLLRWLEGLT
jgi:leucyl aminopeptidase